MPKLVEKYTYYVTYKTDKLKPFQKYLENRHLVSPTVYCAEFPTKFKAGHTLKRYAIKCCSSSRQHCFPAQILSVDWLKTTYIEECLDDEQPFIAYRFTLWPALRAVI